MIFLPLRSFGPWIGKSSGTMSAMSPLRMKPAIEMSGMPLLRATAMEDKAACPMSYCPAPTI